jgi:hypothetical protein
MIETIEQFQALTYPEPNSGCFLFAGPTNGKDYGRVWFRGRRDYAHRVSWMLFRGDEITRGLYVCHRCDTPACVNPDHLFLGTCRDNVRDCIAKGRFKDFSDNGNVAKTHCKSGHPFDEENTAWSVENGRTRRSCRACTRAKHQRYRQAKTLAR